MTDIIVWNEDKNLAEIKKSYAKDLTDLEFSMFVQMGKATGLNPFLREIWAVKFGNNAAQIFIGRDGYRKSAQNHTQYDYHYVEAVYSNDFFEANDGIYSHKFNLKERGELVGAFCNVKRKDSSRPISVFVELREYDLKQSIWKTKPATMIKKVAESQGLRMAFQDLLAGTYEENEIDEEDLNQNNYVQQKKPKPDLPKIENLSEKNIVVDVVTEGQDVLGTSQVSEVKFGESKEDKRLILEKATQISSAFQIDASKNEELIKNICRQALTKEITEKSIDMIISQLFYDVRKNRPDEIIK